MLREVEIRNSSPLLSKPHPPQNSEVQFFPLPVLPSPDISVGGMLAHFVEQWEELTDNRWILSIVQNGFKIQFKSVPLLSIVPRNLIQFSPVIARRDRRTSQETGSGKGTESRNSRFLLLDVTSTGFYWYKKKNGKLRPVIDLSLLNLYNKQSILRWRQSSQ